MSGDPGKVAGMGTEAGTPLRTGDDKSHGAQDPARQAEAGYASFPEQPGGHPHDIPRQSLPGCRLPVQWRPWWSREKPVYW